MTPEAFDEATPQERNEGIALALEWTKVHEATLGDCWLCQWQSPDGVLCWGSRNLPDWQGDAGQIGFLWQAVLKLRPDAVMLRGAFGDAQVRVGDEVYFGLVTAPNCWNIALGKALLSLSWHGDACSYPECACSCREIRDLEVNLEALDIPSIQDKGDR